MLTKRQLQVLNFIDQNNRTTGVGASVREVARSIDHTSPCSAHRTMVELKALGYLAYSENRARTAEIIRMPGDAEYRIFNDQEKRLGAPIPMPKYKKGAPATKAARARYKA